MTCFLSIVLLVLSFATARSQPDTGTHVLISAAVTVRQYMTFLEAAASRSDSHELYSSSMEFQITQSQERTNVRYYFLANGASADQMMVRCNIMQEYRYCNWIEQGSPQNTVAAEASTETGSYDLTGPAVVINPEAKHHLGDESGNIFDIATTTDDSAQEDEASPLAMFRSGGSEEKKKKVPKDNQAASRRESEDNSSELVLRGNPLSQRGPVDPTSQAKTPSSPQSSTREEKISSEEAKIGNENRPRSWEEQSYLAHLAYFERLLNQGK
ncbi:MAG: hypothetical protein NT164_05670 [Verrucomicrobiae bacterium]|nr:hypothetical protein [Verrucomicrobiae bacterium]